MWLLRKWITHLMDIIYQVPFWHGTFSALTLLGSRKGIRPVKKWVVGCWHGYLSRARCRLAYGPADATVICFSKIQTGFAFLVPAYLGSPRKRAVKRVCGCVSQQSKMFSNDPLQSTVSMWNRPVKQTLSVYISTSSSKNKIKTSVSKEMSVYDMHSHGVL